MTVIMVGHKGLPAHSGGIEHHVEELSACLVRAGVRVISFDRAWYVADRPSPAGVERRVSAGVSTKHLDAISHTFTALIRARQDRPDIIHVHGVGPSLLLPLAKVLHPHARLVATFHCVDRTHTKWGGAARLMLRVGELAACLFADRTITVSDALASYCLRNYQCQTSVIPNGVRIPTSHNLTKEPTTDLVGRLGLVPGQYFFMATRLVPHKNVHIAMKAHRLLAERRPDLALAFPLVIAGTSAWTDQYVRELTQHASHLPLVRMLGERQGDELLALQAQAFCHLSVSSSEGMSMALLEAVALARPVIVSNIPENLEVTGDLAPQVVPGDAVALSHAMERVACMTATDRDAMGVQLRERIRVRHDWKLISEMTLDVYRELTEEQGFVSIEKQASAL